MRFTQLELKGVVLVEMEKHCDGRGFFARSYCSREFADAGLPTHWPQMNFSRNIHAGTLRGMHFQHPPHGEPKLVMCIHGAVLDVIIDLRSESPTFLRHVSVQLDADNGKALYIPPGMAHGFQTLMDNTDILYLMGADYVADSADGVRWDDPSFDIAWPLPVSSISPRDASYSLLTSSP